jgi:hypothetical protein
MKAITHVHNGGGNGLAKQFADAFIEETKSVQMALGAKTAPKLRQQLLAKLRSQGWSNQVTIKAKHKITITACNRGVGLCLQTGNVSRIYADLLKLQTAFLSDKITQAIIVVPTRTAARKMGLNLASFDRLVGELAVFRATITVPIVVVGISE